MPYVDVKLNCELSEDKEIKLKSIFGELITILPGKTEQKLIINFQDNCRIWRGGENVNPVAFVNVMVFRTLENEICKRFSDAAIKALKDELSIGEGCVHVKFEEVPNWFWG